MKILLLITLISKAQSGSASTAPQFPTNSGQKKKVFFLSILGRRAPLGLHLVLTQELWKRYSNKVPLPFHVCYFHSFWWLGGGAGRVTWSQIINFIKGLGSTPFSATSGWTACDLEQVSRLAGPRVSAGTQSPLRVGLMLRGEASEVCRARQKLNPRCEIIRTGEAAVVTWVSDFAFIFHFVFFAPVHHFKDILQQIGGGVRSGKKKKEEEMMIGY